MDTLRLQTLVNQNKHTSEKVVRSICRGPQQCVGSRPFPGTNEREARLQQPNNAVGHLAKERDQCLFEWLSERLTPAEG